MTCRTDECCQGRRPCPTPAECSDMPIQFLGDEPEDIGVEAALPAAFTAKPTKPVRRISREKLVILLVVAAALAWAIVWPH